jgi:two-component system phosphate regulon sensor histidine kinase PhoR
MSPLILFWIPAILRLFLIVCAASVVGYFFGIVWFETALCVGLCTLIALQLHYLFRLSLWLDNPESNKLPDGWGAWTDIFSRLYRLRREDEKNQKELSEWLARFRQAMTLLPDGVVIMDDVLFLEWCNPVAEQHLGLDLNKDKNMRVTNLIRSPEFMDYIILGRFEKPITITHRNRKLILHIIQFENRRQILVTHDITESERIDMMRRDFIANASHELRTPLTVINGFLEINAMQSDLDSDTRAGHIKLMLEQGQRMQSLVDDMLTLTRLESIDFPIRPERINMTQLLEQVVSEFQGLSLGKHQLTFINEGPDVMGSSDELRSAFGNLVSNAVRYTPAGGSITISWTNSDAGCVFMVKDSGIGISPEHIARLTERFYRVDKSNSRQTRGTGLGLAIVKHVALRHKAQLVIESTVGVGSEFSIHFSEANRAV